MVLCVDEKSQCQPLERSQPSLPLGLGYVQGYTHDYGRHGTTTLFAALDIADGQVLTQCRPLHRRQEFLDFLRLIARNVPDQLDVHLVVDNDGSHKHATIKGWLARHERFHLHFVPSYSCWLNQVERRCSLITVWHATAGSILEKVGRLCEAISGTDTRQDSPGLRFCSRDSGSLSLSKFTLRGRFREGVPGRDSNDANYARLYCRRVRHTGDKVARFD